MGGKAGGRLLGGVDGCVVLKRILKAIDDLLEVEPPEGVKVHWVVHPDHNVVGWSSVSRKWYHVMPKLMPLTGDYDGPQFSILTP